MTSMLFFDSLFDTNFSLLLLIFLHLKATAVEYEYEEKKSFFTISKHTDSNQLEKENDELKKMMTSNDS
jgi:hypothetical protein